MPKSKMTVPAIDIEKIEKDLESFKHELDTIRYFKLSDMSTDIFDMKNVTADALKKINERIDVLDGDLRQTKLLHGSGLKGLQENSIKDKETNEQILKDMEASIGATRKLAFASLIVGAAGFFAAVASLIIRYRG